MIISIIFSWRNDFISYHPTFQKLYNSLFKGILDKYGVLENEKEYILSYFSFGLVAIVQKWIEKDCEDDVYMIAEIMKKVIGHERKIHD